MNLLERIKWRAGTIESFAKEGRGLSDCIKLGLAGVARRRPFDERSAYGRIFRIFGHEVLVRIKKATGIAIRLNLTNFVDLTVFEEVVIEDIYPLDRLPFMPELIVDAGACRGLFSLLAHARYPAAVLVCIEPEPTNAAMLRRHLTDNNIEADVIEAALSASEGPVCFSGDGFGGHICELSESGGVKVASVSLTDIFQKHRDKRLLLKMDIEGAEKLVLPSVVRFLPRDTVLFLETHHSEEECDDYLRELRASGFRETVIRRRVNDEATNEYVERVFVRAK